MKTTKYPLNKSVKSLYERVIKIAEYKKIVFKKFDILKLVLSYNK